MTIENRLFRYVIAVAEDLHFSRAADRLNVAQPALSRQIKNLETNLGVMLFERTHSSVRLTPAGDDFVLYAREALHQAELAALAALAHKQSDVLKLAHSPHTDPQLLTRVLDNLKKTSPEVAVSTHSLSSHEQVERIRKCEMDAGLAILPLKHPDITTSPISAEPLMLVVQKKSPFASTANPVGMHDLNGIPLIVFRRELHIASYDHCANRCRTHGISPNIKHEVSSLAEAFQLVDQGSGAALALAHYQAICPEYLCFLPIEGDLFKIRTGLVLRKGTTHVSIKPLLEVVHGLRQRRLRAAG